MLYAADIEGRLRARLAEVTDPELPVPITELGMVRSVEIHRGPSGDGCRAHVTLVPTFLGCPAQIFIERDVRATVGVLPGLDELRVSWSPATEWSVAQITAEGRRMLAEVGVAVPDPTGDWRCPNCGSDRVVVDSDFGSALCRRLAHCEACGDPVEVMRARPHRSPQQHR